MPTSNDIINQAIGVLMWREDLDENQAFHWLARVAQDDRSRVIEAARDVIEHAVNQKPYGS